MGLMTFLHMVEFLRAQSEEAFSRENAPAVAQPSTGDPMAEMQARLAGVRGAPKMPRGRARS